MTLTYGGSSGVDTPVLAPTTLESAVTARPPRLAAKASLVAADGIVLAVSMALAFAFRSSVTGADVDAARAEHALLAVAALPVWLGLFARGRLYNARFLDRRLDELRRITSASVSALMAATVAAYALELPVSRAWLVLTFAIALPLMVVERQIVRSVFGALRKSGRILRRVVIVGSNNEARDVAATMEASPRLGYQVVGFIDDAEDGVVRVLGPVAQTLDIVRRVGANSVIVATSATSVATTNRLVRELLREGIHVELSSTLRDIAAHRLTVHPVGRYPIVYLEPCESSGWRALAKRSFDVAVASVCLLAVAPIAAVVAIAIKLDSRGPVVYRQRRVGKDGCVFEFRKFRSMVDGAHAQWIDLRDQHNDARGPIFKLRDDPRVTRVGKILRKTSLDELPQLWNVVWGEMSLVGPRPALPEEMDLWDDQLHDRLRVRPGITGMWQVSGRHDHDESMDEYSRLDLYYVDNWSLLTDLFILLKTIPVVLFGRGSY